MCAICYWPSVVECETCPIKYCENCQNQSFSLHRITCQIFKDFSVNPQPSKDHYIAILFLKGLPELVELVYIRTANECATADEDEIRSTMGLETGDAIDVVSVQKPSAESVEHCEDYWRVDMDASMKRPIIC